MKGTFLLEFYVAKERNSTVFSEDLWVRTVDRVL